MAVNQFSKILRAPGQQMTAVLRKFANIGSGDRIEKSFNEVRLLGRAGVEAKKGGTEAHPVVYFSLATTNSYKAGDTGEYTQKTDWHRVVVFKPNLRESVYNYLQKGQRVYVAGRLSYGEITDASGQTKPTTAIIADDVIFFTSKGG